MNKLNQYRKTDHFLLAQHGTDRDAPSRSGAVRTRSRAPLTVLCTVLGLFSCDATTSVTERLVACGLLSNGEIGPGTVPLRAPDACYENCFGEASCDELTDALCGTSIDLARRCDRRCAFECADGSLIALTSVCDGIESCCDDPEACDDTSDEDGCEPFRCGETELSQAALCDGYEECADGSDEADCPMFTCVDDGREIPLEYRCDGWAYCTDESDEAGCAELTLECPEM